MLLAIRLPMPPDTIATTENDSLHCYFPSGAVDYRYAFFECVACGRIDVAWVDWTFGCWCDVDSRGAWRTPRIEAAFVAARSERFGT